MPKGRFAKLKDSLCNMPVDSNDLTNVLPQGANSSETLVVKLKRKLSYRGYVYFEAGRLETNNISSFNVLKARQQFIS